MTQELADSIARQVGQEEGVPLIGMRIGSPPNAPTPEYVTVKTNSLDGWSEGALRFAVRFSLIVRSQPADAPMWAAWLLIPGLAILLLMRWELRHTLWGPLLEWTVVLASYACLLFLLRHETAYQDATFGAAIRCSEDFAAAKEFLTRTSDTYISVGDRRTAAAWRIVEKRWLQALKRRARVLAKADR